MKLLNSTSFHGWCRRFFKWVGERERERERERWAERERERDGQRERYGQRERERERERDCLLLGAEMVSSIVMYNFGVGPRGPYVYSILEGRQSNLLLWGSG